MFKNNQIASGQAGGLSGIHSPFKIPVIHPANSLLHSIGVEAEKTALLKNPHLTDDEIILKKIEAMSSHLQTLDFFEDVKTVDFSAEETFTLLQWKDSLEESKTQSQMHEESLSECKKLRDSLQGKERGLNNAAIRELKMKIRECRSECHLYEKMIGEVFAKKEVPNKFIPFFFS